MNKKKVIIFFAGASSSQVLDVLLDDVEVEIVGYLDDSREKIGKEFYGKRVLGKVSDFEKFYNEGVFTHAIIGIGNIKVRKEVYDNCKKIGIPFVNAIDKSVNIRNHVKIGEGNILLGKVYIGNSATLGNNNYISSGATIEHHCTIGDHVFSGPNLCMTGGCYIGNEISFGMNIGLQYSNVGSNSIVNSGIILIKNIPENSNVKKKMDYVISEKENGLKQSSKGWVKG